MTTENATTFVTAGTCKSPAHRRYREALEGLYIQAALAQKDLATVLNECRAENPAEPWRPMTFKQHKLDEATERLAFGRTELEAATRAVDAHIDHGCRNLPPEPGIPVTAEPGSLAARVLGIAQTP